MSTDQNLLFGVLALQAGLLDPAQFAAACSVLATEQDVSLADWLVERGWLAASDRARVEDLIARRLKEHQGGLSPSLEAAPTVVRQGPDSGTGSDLPPLQGTIDLVRVGLGQATDPSTQQTQATAEGPPGGTGSPTPSAAEDRRGRYTLTRLHAQGGIGQVWLARDADLGREVALKELKPQGPDHSSAQARFLEEACITGQLEHPGIVPVHELVRPAEGRPFYTMRLVRGRTLAEAIKDYHEKRQAGLGGPLELRGLLSAFVVVCNAVDYAHSRGVLHRDLKPANVVLGEYGEVVVLDWGLAKLVGRAGSPQRPQPDDSRTADLLPVALEAEAHKQTVQGQVLGTPAYMAPEQAEGQLALLGPATDVYGLGAVLYELLTGVPPFSGGLTEVLRQVASREPIRPGLVVPQTPPALEAVCRKAMAKEPAQRYGSAGELAREVERWLADEPIRAWREPWRLRLGRWVRRHQPLVAAVAAGLLVVLLVGGAGAVWVGREQERRRSAAESALDEVDRLLHQARWPEARAALERADARLGESGRADLRRRLAQGRADLALVDRLDTIRLERANVVGSQLDHAGADSRYAEAFAAAGLAEVGEDEETAGRRVAHSAVQEALVAALDDWASATEDRARRAWILGVARRADRHPWRDRLRDPAAWQNEQALARLAAQAPPSALTPNLAATLGKRLARTAEGEALLREAQRRRPGDFWLNHYLGGSLAQRRRAREAESYYRAALAARPDSAVAHANLGVVLGWQGRWAEAEQMYRAALEREPSYANVYANLGGVLAQQGKTAEAEKQYRKALEIAPKHANARGNLARILQQLGRWAEAEKVYREMIAIEPGNAGAHANLGQVLLQQGKRPEAQKQLSKAVELDPNHAAAHANLGVILQGQGKVAEAEKHHRRAIALDPGNAAAHVNLGQLMLRQRRWAEAEKLLRRAVELAPGRANTHNNLGLALAEQGKLAEAEKQFRKAAEIDPKHAWAHTNLGEALQMRGQWAEAEKEHRRAIALDGKIASAHANLGFVLQSQGKWAEAAACYRQALGVQPNNTQARARLPLAQRLAALEPAVPALLEGKYRPLSNQERLELAVLCRSRRLYRAAAGLYADAFATDGKSADDLKTGVRYTAAVAAALAGCGKGEDAGKLDDKEKTRLRGQALDWLRADLALHAKQLDKGSSASRAAVVAKLKHWRQDNDLAGVRDREALAALPEDERAGWDKLWTEVAALLDKASKKTP
jgi:serine/threonine-protein kinase